MVDISLNQTKPKLKQPWRDGYAIKFSHFAYSKYFTIIFISNLCIVSDLVQ